MSQIRCINCAGIFQPIPQVRNQIYCSKEACQKERRREWQKKKRKNDQDYKDNQYRAQRAWAERNPDYWRDYRKKSTNSSPLSNSQNNKPNKTKKGENEYSQSDEQINSKWHAIQDGTYRLRVIEKSSSKMDVWIIELAKLVDR
jgi:hypothetical protein